MREVPEELMKLLKAAIDEELENTPDDQVLDVHIRTTPKGVELLFQRKQMTKDEQEDEDVWYQCCMCGIEIEGMGHNAQPLRGGRCCDDCNQTVIEHRLALMLGVDE